MSSRTAEVFGNICITCVVAGLTVMALASAATLLWVGFIQ